ncbi:zinc finger MYND domain-containing protein [Phanerochaete sordida]|uniref:Zinc finger MYND domain-containing protein n=1 Tax=Phanerochaete sordida TaxID=48140 RepID=A0A9P3LM05_9APHY|nr:zinc finger MYND domain-containing protein [Phanerochaete sordida]
MGRRERRAAARHWAAHPTPSRFGVQKTFSDADMARFLASTGARADGFGVDLLKFTDAFAKANTEFCSSESYDVVKRLRVNRKQLWREDRLVEHKKFADIFKRHLRVAKRTAVSCERDHCGRVGAEDKMSRCKHCLQVVYCSVECQSQDRARHREFCDTADPETIEKDLFGRMLRAFSIDPAIAQEYSTYRHLVLQDAKKHVPDGRLHWMLELGFELVPDPVHKPGRESNMYMLQLSNVWQKPVSWSEGDPAVGDADSSSFTALRMNTKGVSAPQTQIHVNDELFIYEPTFAPIFFLGLINLLIREDVDNVLHLRVPKSFAKSPKRPDDSSASTSRLALEEPENSVERLLIGLSVD